MELTITEIPFKEFFESLETVGDGYYAGTEAFKLDEAPRNEILLWKDAKLYRCRIKGDYRDCWVVIKPDPEIAPGSCYSLWYFFNWSGGYRDIVTDITVTMHGSRNILRYTGIERADGFDDLKGFDELITALTCVKEAFVQYDFKQS